MSANTLRWPYSNNDKKGFEMDTRAIRGGALAISIAVLVLGGILLRDPPADVDPSPGNASARTANGVSTGPASIPGISETGQGLQLDAEARAQLQQIGEAYAAQIRYPEFSQPIDPDNLESKYLPDVPVATELPADLRDPNSPILSLLPNQFRFFEGDALLVSAQIKGLPDDVTSAINAELTRQGQVLAQATVYPADEPAHSYVLDFGTLRLPDVSWQQELQVNAEFQFAGKTTTRSVTVEYHQTVARVEQVGPSSVEGEYLQIPVYVSTDKPGFHRLKANLYDAETGKPLVHLRAEESLDSAQGQLLLRAHIGALKAAGSEGPYELRDLQLSRMPSSPDYITEFGRIEQGVIAIEGHAFESYDDKPYHNEKSQRILKELSRLGS